MKELVEIYQADWEAYAGKKIALRKSILDLMKAILEKYDNKIDFNYTNEEGEDFFERLSNTLGGVYINYDGGNHPEYASNSFSEVRGVFYEDKTIYVDIEDCTYYSVDRIWSVDELASVVDALIAYDDFRSEIKSE